MLQIHRHISYPNISLCSVKINLKILESNKKSSEVVSIQQIYYEAVNLYIYIYIWVVTMIGMKMIDEKRSHNVSDYNTVRSVNFYNMWIRVTCKTNGLIIYCMMS